MSPVPLQQKGPDQEIVTQFDGTAIESIGLLKIDFLGLRNLDVIDKAVALVPGLDIATIPLDDRKTYEMLARGEAIGVFQFESSGMRDALRQVKPTEFEDLIALVALYRPGPDAVHPASTRAARTAGSRSRTPTRGSSRSPARRTGSASTRSSTWRSRSRSPASRPPRPTTCARRSARRSTRSWRPSRASSSRAARRTDGAGVAEQLWADMEKSQDYSFNKSHAACYALISYRTAWLRANHPREYMAALISSVMNTKDKVPFYVAACDEMGIEVLPPDVNESQVDFAVVEGKIRFGLNAVKNVGEATCRAIVAAREEGGPFASIWDFTERVDPSVANKRALESLVKCGAFDSTGASRRGMLDVLEDALSLRPDAAAGPAARPGLDLRPRRLAAPASARHHATIPTGEFEKAELLRLEKESLGLYVSEHPLSADPRPAAPARPTARSPSSSGGARARPSSSAASSPRCARR